MLFPTHLVAGYLVGRRAVPPASWAVAGAALPDLLDKPLAMAGITGLYQTVGHSLLALAVLGLLARRGPRWLALWAGWASHLALDAVHMVVNGRAADVAFLAWPAIRHAPAVQLPPAEFAAYYAGTPSFYLEVLVWLVAVLAVGTGWHRGRADARTD